MAQRNWFNPIESMFYEALYYYDIHDWGIQPMPKNVNTQKEDLREGAKRNWPFRTHNAKGEFKCYKCGKWWQSSYTTVIWRARWDIGIVQIAIEKQGCRKCNKKCQGFLIDEEQIEFTLDCMCMWILEEFYGIKNEKNEGTDDEPDKEEESNGPHDSERCQAGKKGTCKKCNIIKRRLN